MIHLIFTVRFFLSECKESSINVWSKIEKRKVQPCDSSSKWDAVHNVSRAGNFSVNDYQITGVYCQSLLGAGFRVSGSKPRFLAFDVEKRKRRERNSFAGQLLQLLQLFRDLSLVNAFNLLESAVFKNLKCCIRQALYQILLEKRFAHFLSSPVVVSFLFEYLMGYIERGGWATYSDTSWEFRATYVSIELRLAAYFWFKFRALPSSPERGRKRSRAELKGTPSVSDRNVSNKFETRLKAKLQNGDPRMGHVWLREYDTREEAEGAYWVGAYYYNRWDRINDDLLSWFKANLPPIAPHLSADEKASWVRVQAEDYLTRMRHQDQGAVAGEPHQRVIAMEPHQGVVTVEPHPGVFAVEPNQEAGYVGLVISRTAEGEDLLPIDDWWQSWPALRGDIEFMEEEFTSGGHHQADSTGIGLGQPDGGDITVDDYGVGVFSMLLGEESEQGGGSECLNLPRTCWDPSASQQQDIQDLQQSHESAIVLEGGGAAAEVGGMRQGETDQENSVLRASANHTQVVDPPIVAQEEIEELIFSDTIDSIFRELRELGWDFKMQPRVSEIFSLSFSKCEGRKRPTISSANYFAFQELHEQGYKITLEPLSNASTQVTESALSLSNLVFLDSGYCKSLGIFLNGQGIEM
jgi:hypothetical protein